MSRALTYLDSGTIISSHSPSTYRSIRTFAKPSCTDWFAMNDACLCGDDAFMGACMHARVYAGACGCFMCITCAYV